MTAGELGATHVPTAGLSPPASRRNAAPASRRVLWGGFAGFLLILGASIAIWGVPWSRDRLAIWVVAGLLATSLSDLRGWARGLLLDWAPLLAVLFAYDLLRGYADGVLAGAYVYPQLRFDEWLFGGTVPTVALQEHFYNPGAPRWYDFAAWAVYTSHFFVTITVAAVLWRVAYPRFRAFAGRFVALTFLGFITYVLVPAVPPWLASWDGYLDATQRLMPQMWRYVGVEPAAMLFEGGNRYANDVAALPSLHAAYPVLLLLFFWRSTGAAVRLLLGAYTLAMGLTLVYSAEHYVADIVLGWLYAVVVFAVVEWFARWRVQGARAGDSRPAGATL